MSYSDLVNSTEVTLKTLCGTSKNGQANACDHDHRPMAAALVRQISHATVTDFAQRYALDEDVQQRARDYALTQEAGA